jgi:hypothetical protein
MHWRATLVRHFIDIGASAGQAQAASASTPASRARRMLEPAAAAVLVALGAVPTVFVAAGGRARWAAIQLAVIAVGTQHDLLAATHAQEQAG